MKSAGVVFPVALICCAATLAQSQSPQVQVAAAADLKFAMDEIAQRFETQTGTKVNVTYGSSGNFLTQLRNGAPFDLFFSADLDYPRQLESAGLAEPKTLREYAAGRIVIWMPRDSKVDIAKDGLEALLSPNIRKIAIANPDHAPYGRAAVATLKKAGIYERVKEKLVLGENISQAAQFVQSGNAQAGIIALSLAISAGMREGKRWMIPQEMASPVEQAAIILANAKNKQQARIFLDFVMSLEGRAILDKFGFAPPAVDAHAAGKR